MFHMNSNKEHGTTVATAVTQRVFASLGRFASNIPDAVIDAQVLGPPDIEKKVGLTGGHIFQGECLPQYMWSNRLSPRTPCPASISAERAPTPAARCIGINGRNAAMAVLKDLAG